LDIVAERSSSGGIFAGLNFHIEYQLWFKVFS
jgi:hypothetical protein